MINATLVTLDKNYHLIAIDGRSLINSSSAPILSVVVIVKERLAVDPLALLVCGNQQSEPVVRW